MTFNLLQVYCVFLFMSSAFLFGILVSQINEIVAAKQVKTKELDNILDAYTSINPRPAVLQIRLAHMSIAVSFITGLDAFLYISRFLKLL